MLPPMAFQFRPCVQGDVAHRTDVLPQIIVCCTAFPVHQSSRVVVKNTSTLFGLHFSQTFAQPHTLPHLNFRRRQASRPRPSHRFMFRLILAGFPLRANPQESAEYMIRGPTTKRLAEGTPGSILKVVRRKTWRFIGVCGICGWTTPAGTSWIITGNWVAAHVGEKHPASEGFVGYFFRKKVVST
jgi:hypothetical protein